LIAHQDLTVHLRSSIRVISPIALKIYTVIADDETLWNVSAKPPSRKHLSVSTPKRLDPL
jgi:hypothetical protein